MLFVKWPLSIDVGKNTTLQRFYAHLLFWFTFVAEPLSLRNAFKLWFEAIHVVTPVATVANQHLLRVALLSADATPHI